MYYLDVSGSFIATTASTIQFGSQGTFGSATLESPVLLTVDPSALLFEQLSPAAIVNQSTAFLSVEQQGLQVPDSESLLLVGGDIRMIGGGLNAEAGTVGLAAVASQGSVGINLENNSSFDVSEMSSAISDRSDISLTDGATINTSGEQGGAVELWGRNIVIDSGAQIAASTQGISSGRSVTLNASEKVEIISFAPPFGSISTLSFGEGNAGDINIETRILRLRDKGFVFTAALGSGSAGQLTVNATDLVEIIGRDDPLIPTSTGLSSVSLGTGSAGHLDINTRRLIIQDNGVLTTQATVLVENGEEIIASGQAGDLTINASDSITLNREALVFAGTQGAGEGGNIVINTDRLSAQNTSVIATQGFDSGDAGNLAVYADSIVLKNQSQIETTTERSQGRNITLQVSDLLLLRQNSSISTEAGTDGAGGNGGDIVIAAPDGFVVALPDENSDIHANAFEGDGGNVDITARNLLGLTFRPSVLDTPQSDITASSRFGSDGTVVINELNTEVLRSDAELPAEVSPPPLATGCRTPSSQASSFVITGRGGLPSNPLDSTTTTLWQDLLPIERNELANQQMNSELNTVGNGREVTTPIPIVEVQGWVKNERGQVVLVADGSQRTALNHFEDC